MLCWLMPTPDARNATTTRRRFYAHPPIRERVVEVHAIPGPTNLETARDALAQRWSDFRRIETQTLGGIQIEWKPGKGSLMTSQESNLRLRFWDDNNTRLLQAGLDLFAANDLRPEPGWEELGPMFRRAFNDYKAVMQPRQTTKAIMRYLNRVPVPQGVSVGELFTIFPNLPEDRQRVRAPFHMVVDMGQEFAGPSIISLAFVAQAGEPFYALDLVVESGTRDLSNDAALFDWTEEAHTRMTQLFEQSITPQARDTFEERRGP